MRITVIVALLALLAGAGCAQVKPFKPAAVDDIPEGPGLFSGEDGEFVIYRQ